MQRYGISYLCFVGGVGYHVLAEGGAVGDTISNTMHPVFGCY